MEPRRHGARKNQQIAASVVLGLPIAVVCGVVLLPCSGPLNNPIAQASVTYNAPANAAASVPVPLVLEPITPALRKKGYNLCNPHDPIGLGPYRPYVPLTTGRVLIPQEGGYTPDHGFDVLVHFHGHHAARIPLVQVSRGTVFVGSDFGVGSYAYSKAFSIWRRFPNMLRSLAQTLRKSTGFEDAHIRHLTLSAWSAGYGAINEILKLHGDEGIDAVVLLDAMHASWNPQARKPEGIGAVMLRRIEPLVAFARKAQRGEKLFVFTHSEVETTSYVSTQLTAQKLLMELGLQSHPVAGGQGAYPQVGAVDEEGLHVWSYSGKGELAHCSHLRLLARVVRDVLEPAFDTPAMNRDVPPTKAPLLGNADAGDADGAAPEGGAPEGGADADAPNGQDAGLRG